ncbi:MAG: hypothetical protein ACK4LQ_14805 [Pararhodobacter sp.]
MTQSSRAPFPAASSQPQSQPLLQSRPDPAAHPGFALARSWRDQICGSIAEILATTAADPRDDDRDDADDCSDDRDDADDEARSDRGGQTGTAAFDDDADADWRDPPMKLSSKPAQKPSETAVSTARHRRELLPLELVLILTLAEAIERRSWR